jgi:hypothetical protein
MISSPRQEASESETDMEQNIENLIAKIRNNSTFIAKRIVEGEKSGYVWSATHDLISMNLGMMLALETIGYRDIAESLANEEKQMIRNAHESKG